jgi:hypothetical protein
MSSIFTTSKEAKINTPFGRGKFIPFYLQFVPGYCVDVVHNSNSDRGAGDSSINTIIAIPHITNKLLEKRATAGEDSRYFPLLRTFNDVPSKGDPVLLCTIGNINYYLGPLNTINNSPTWNDDPSFTEEFAVNNKDVIQVTNRSKTGESLNFIKEVKYRRLQKRYNPKLEEGDAINETTGDTILEGRHGNSLRIGSVGAKPYLIISNKRNPANKNESLGDGSIISITSESTLQDHFSVYTDSVAEKNVFEFKLSSDTIEENNYPIGDIYTSVNGFSDDSFIYSYNDNQMLLHSDRIILNSKIDNIYISSKKDIHIGAGEHTTISSGKSIIVNTPDFNIGNPNDEFVDMQPMVLGNELKNLLTRIVGLFDTVMTAGGMNPSKLVTDITEIEIIKQDIDKITSNFHKIEGND